MVGGIRPSAGVVLPLLPPALLHYTINRRKLQAVRQKFLQKKRRCWGVCAPRGTGSPCRCGKLNGGACPGVAGAAGVSDTRRGACPVGRLPTLPLPSFLPPIPPAPFPGGEGGAPKFISPGASPPAPLHLTACGTHRACQAGTRRQKSAIAAKTTGSGSL